MFGYSNKEKFFQGFARIGLSAKGLVYCLLSVLAFMAALGQSSRKGNKEEAFKVIHEQPFGQILLIIVGISLLGFVLLRFFQAVLDSDDKGKGTKAILKRLGLAGSGLIYLSISLYVLKLAFGAASDGDTKQLIIAKVLEYSFGQLVIGLAAAFVVGQGVYQIFRGISGKFMKKVQLYNSNFSGTFKTVGQVGYTARGIVLCLIGYLLFRAAWETNPKRAEGTEGAFDFLQNNFGGWILAIVPIGLFAYGIFMFVRAKHEKMQFKV